MKVVVTAECGAPPEVVFGANMDIPNWPRFIDGVKKLDILSGGPIAIGTRFRTTRLVRGHRISSEMKLAVMQAPWRIAFTVAEESWRRVFATEIVPDGIGSHLTMSCEVIPFTFAAHLRNLFSFLPPRGLRKQLRDDITDIVREAERRVRA